MMDANDGSLIESKSIVRLVPKLWIVGVGRRSSPCLNYLRRVLLMDITSFNGQALDTAVPHCVTRRCDH